MLTFEFTSFWPEQQELKQECIDVVTMYLGEPNKLVVMKEDAEDLASSFSVLMHYDGLRLNEVPVWDELREFAAANEIYALAYDHHSNIRKGYWYDEEEDWIFQELEKPAYILALAC